MKKIFTSLMYKWVEQAVFSGLSTGKVYINTDLSVYLRKRTVYIP